MHSHAQARAAAHARLVRIALPPPPPRLGFRGGVWNSRRLVGAAASGDAKTAAGPRGSSQDPDLMEATRISDPGSKLECWTEEAAGAEARGVPGAEWSVGRGEVGGRCAGEWVCVCRRWRLVLPCPDIWRRS